MSIRDELKAKYEQYQKEKEELLKKTTQEYEVEARDFIQNSIIPQFREQASCSRNKSMFFIAFINEENHFRNLNNPDELIKHEIMLAATQISSEYDINYRITYSPKRDKIDSVSFLLSIL